MTVFSRLSSRLRGRPDLFTRFAADRRGVAAIEFALIVPLLLSLYITSFELTMGISMAQRVTHAADTIADLIAREGAVDTDKLADMEQLALRLFAPYRGEELSIRITGVALDSASNPTVHWSWQNDGTAPYAVGTPVAMPEDMRTPDIFAVRAEVSVKHQLLIFMAGYGKSDLRSITIGRENYYRQRGDGGIECADCPSAAKT